MKGSYHIRDPSLTQLGTKECLTLKNTFPHHDDVDIVMASPMKRTIQTAILSFGPSLSKSDVPFLLVPHAQEISAFPCDVGSDREYLDRILEDVLTEASLDMSRLDVSILDSQWNTKVRKWGFPIGLCEY